MSNLNQTNNENIYNDAIQTNEFQDQSVINDNSTNRIIYKRIIYNLSYQKNNNRKLPPKFRIYPDDIKISTIDEQI